MPESIVTKRCSKCKIEKPLTEFYKRLGSKDGHRNDCIQCNQKQKQEYTHTPKGIRVHRRARRKYGRTDKSRKAQKRYSQSPKGKLVNCRKTDRYRKRHPLYTQASHAVNRAIRAGHIPRPDTFQCSQECSKRAEQYHHHLGYAPEHWLDVVPVCIPCHHSLHPSMLKSA